MLVLRNLAWADRGHSLSWSPREVSLGHKISQWFGHMEFEISKCLSRT